MRFPLIHGVGERLPFADQCFDLVVSEYGSAIWSDPHVWIPEAARVLRPGGELIFLGNSVLFVLTAPDYLGNPATNTLLRPQFGMHRFEWPDDTSVEFHLSHGEMIRLLRATGFEILDLIEIRAPEGPEETRFEISREWAPNGRRRKSGGCGNPADQSSCRSSQRWIPATCIGQNVFRSYWSMSSSPIPSLR